MPTVLPANPVLFGGPVQGYIHPKGWVRPAGNVDFVITQLEGCTGVPAEPPLGACPHFHRAIDIANRHCGAPVFAPRDGVVHWSGIASDGANIIVLNHGGGWGSAAVHLSARLVGKGAHVKKGQKIGYIGSTGNSTGCHDHFPIKSGVDWTKSFWSDSNGRWENPSRLLEQNVVVRPKGAGINIRTSPGAAGTTAAGAIYAHVDAAGHIRRNSDNADLGLASAWRDWGGAVTGSTYTVGGVKSAVWDKIMLGGAWRYVGRLVDQLAS